MISIEFYKVLHLLGIFMLFISLGGLALHSLNGGTRQTNQGRVLIALTHGFGMIFTLIAGFGMLARLGISPMSLPAWAAIKFLIWLVFGAAIALAYRMPKFAKVLWFVLLALGFTAAVLAIYQPT